VGIVGFSIMGLRATEKGRGHFAHKILIVLVAITSYIALAFTQGVERAGEYTYFGYARFIDWSVTTPLLLLGLALLALPRARDSLPLVLSIMAVDLYMIATGLFAGLSGEGRGLWWLWFIAATGGVASRNNLSSSGVSSPQIVGKHPQNTLASAVTVTRMWKALI
jgi:bacteriorhodopsin